MIVTLLSWGRFRSVFALLAMAGFFSGLAGLYLKGQILEGLVTKSPIGQPFLLLMVAFVGATLLASLLQTVMAFWREWIKSRVFDQGWRGAGKRSLSAAGAERFESFFQNTTQRSPALFDLRTGLVISYATVAVVYGTYVFKVVQDELWIAFAIVPILSCFSWFSGWFLKRRIKAADRAFQLQQSTLLRFCEEYFLSYRERQLNQVGNHLYQSAGGDFRGAWRKHLKWQFAKSLGVFGCVDVPFMLSMSLVFLATAFGYIGFADLVVWIGLIEYLVQANGHIASAMHARVRVQTLEQVIAEERSQWQKEASIQAPNLPTGMVEVRLLDGSPVRVTGEPGIYRISGSNGSGKSTLLNILAGLEDRYEHWNREQLEQLAGELRGATRVIERFPVVYQAFPNLAAQISGDPHTAADPVRERLERNLHTLLPGDLVTSWMQVIGDLFGKWEERQRKSLSSGEGVVLSFARMIYGVESWPKAMIVDEVESVLDAERQLLFRRTLACFARKVAIYYVSHAKSRSPEKASIVCSAFALGYSETRQAARVFELRLAAQDQGSGRIRCYGNLGSQFQHDAEIVLRALVHTRRELAYLQECNFDLECEAAGFQVREGSSARLAIAIAFLNIHRVCKGLPPLTGQAASGYVRLDGGIDPVNHLSEKCAAARTETYINAVHTHHTHQHLDSLYRAMMETSPELSRQEPSQPERLAINH